MKTRLLVFCLSSFFICIASCRYDKYAAPEAPPSPGNTVVSYQTDIHPMMVLYCYGQGNQACHVTVSNQGANGDFTSYAGLKAKVDNGSIQARVINTGGGMPPSYSNGPNHLLAADRQKLISWMSNGALNN